MAPTTEVLIFETSDTFRKNPQIILPAYNIVLEREGTRAPGYYGKQIEDPSTGYIFLDWDSYEAHKSTMDGPSFPIIMEAAKPCFSASGKREMYHVQFSGPTVALNQPVIEMSILTLKAPENHEAVVELLVEASEKTGKMLVFGKTHEDENKYIVICGWPTVQAHLDHLAQPEQASAVAKLCSLTDKEHACHTQLWQYHGYHKQSLQC